MRIKIRRGGFTLPEVLVTVTVVAVLAAVVVPAVTQFANEGDAPAQRQDFDAIRAAVTSYVTVNRAYPTDLYAVTKYASGLSFGSTATTATYTSKGYGFKVSNAFASDITLNGQAFITLSLSSATHNTCAEIDAAIDDGNGGTAGMFQYDATAGANTTCGTSGTVNWLLMPRGTI